MLRVVRALCPLLLPFSEYVLLRYLLHSVLGLSIGWGVLVTDYDLFLPLSMSAFLFFLLVSEKGGERPKLQVPTARFHFTVLALFVAVNVLRSVVGGEFNGAYFFSWWGLCLAVFGTASFVFFPFKSVLLSGKRFVILPCLFLGFSTVIAQNLTSGFWTLMRYPLVSHLRTVLAWVFPGKVETALVDPHGFLLVRYQDLHILVGQGCGGLDGLVLLVSALLFAFHFRILSFERKSIVLFLLFAFVGAYFLNVARIACLFMVGVGLRSFLSLGTTNFLLFSIFHMHLGWLFFCVGLPAMYFAWVRMDAWWEKHKIGAYPLMKRPEALLILIALVLGMPRAASAVDLKDYLEDAVLLNSHLDEFFSYASRHSSLNSPALCNGRLTLESGVGVSTSDQSNLGTLYFTPFEGGKVAVYDGSKWLFNSFTEKSISLAGIVQDGNYDVFVYSNSGTLAMELSAVWTSGVLRADALALQDGVYVKSGTPTRRWVGTIRGSAADQTSDTLLKRFVWNECQRRTRPMQVLEPTATWTYNSTTTRNVRAQASNRVEYVAGRADVLVRGNAFMRVGGSSCATNLSGIGIDSTTDVTILYGGGCPLANNGYQAMGLYSGMPGLGYHYLQWLETNSGCANASLIGANTYTQSGLVFSVEG